MATIIPGGTINYRERSMAPSSQLRQTIIQIGLRLFQRYDEIERLHQQQPAKVDQLFLDGPPATLNLYFGWTYAGLDALHGSPRMQVDLDFVFTEGNHDTPISFQVLFNVQSTASGAYQVQEPLQAECVFVRPRTAAFEQLAPEEAAVWHISDGEAVNGLLRLEKLDLRYLFLRAFAKYMTGHDHPYVVSYYDEDVEDYLDALEDQVAKDRHCTNQQLTDALQPLIGRLCASFDYYAANFYDATGDMDLFTCDVGKFNITITKWIDYGAQQLKYGVMFVTRPSAALVRFELVVDNQLGMATDPIDPAFELQSRIADGNCDLRTEPQLEDHKQLYERRQLLLAVHANQYRIETEVKRCIAEQVYEQNMKG